MFRFIIPAAIAVVFFVAPARADISSDLKFCADLKSGKERLACYDAAARIEKSTGSQVVTRTPLALVSVKQPHALSASLALPAPAPKYEGLYLGITGGYQMATRAQDEGRFNPLPGSERGWKVGGVAGYGKEIGPLYLGFEARGQHSSVKSQLTRTGGNTYSFPYVQQSITCYGCDQSYFDNYPRPSNDPLYISGSYDYLARRTQDWQFDFTIRPGLIVSDWLLYAKIGAGVEQMTDSTTQTIASTLCTPVYERRRPDAQTIQDVVVSCGNPVTTRNQIDTLLKTISPVGILGVGVERSFGSVFVRAEGELTMHYAPQYAVYYSPSFNLVTGYRF